MKKVLVPLVILCLVSLAMPGLAADAPHKHGLQNADSAWVKAMLANDAAACAAVYAEDAVLVLPGSGPIKGREAIRQAYAGWLAQVHVTAAEITDAHYESSGNLSTGWGSWKVVSEPKAGGAAVTETGTWCAVAMKKDGAWKYVADHAAADPAPAK